MNEIERQFPPNFPNRFISNTIFVIFHTILSQTQEFYKKYYAIGLLSSHSRVISLFFDVFYYTSIFNLICR